MIKIWILKTSRACGKQENNKNVTSDDGNNEYRWKIKSAFIIIICLYTIDWSNIKHKRLNDLNPEERLLVYFLFKNSKFQLEF